MKKANAAIGAGKANGATDRRGLGHVPKTPPRAGSDFERGFPLAFVPAVSPTVLGSALLAAGRALAELLGLSVGECWSYAARLMLDGRAEGYVPPARLEFFERRCGWDGPDGELLRVLLVLGLVEPHPAGGFRVQVLQFQAPA